MFVASEKTFGKSGERRSGPRIDAALTCSVTFEDGIRHECTSNDISLDSVALNIERAGIIGERAVLYIGGIGWIDGTVVRATQDLIVLKIALSERRRGWLLRRIEIVNAIAARIPHKREAPAAPTPTGAEMRRFYKNLETVIKDLLVNSRTAA